jgi:hypothetical protein
MTKLPSATEDTRRDLDREADLVEQFARLYRAELAHLIQRLNRSATVVIPGADPAAADSIRHCVEAVDMVLASHAAFARSLKRLALTIDAPAQLRAA